jgi:hypothetical protein
MLEIGKTEIVRAKELLAVSSSRKELRVEIGTKPFSSSVNGVMHGGMVVEAGEPRLGKRRKTAHVLKNDRTTSLHVHSSAVGPDLDFSTHTSVVVTQWIQWLSWFSPRLPRRG